MDAKQLQLGLTALAAVAVIYAAARTVRAVVDGRRPALRNAGFWLSAAGTVVFVRLAFAFWTPPPGWEDPNPANNGYNWFLVVPALVLASITVLAALDRRAGGRLLAIVGGVTGLLVAAAFAIGVLSGTSSEGAAPALFATLVLFVVPALITAIILLAKPSSTAATS